MQRRILIIAVIAGTLICGIARAEEVNPVLGKTADYIIRESDLERLVSLQPKEIQQELQSDPEKKVTMVEQLLTMKAIAAKVRQEGFDRKPEVREQLGLVIDDFLARQYIEKVVAGSVVVSEADLKKAYKEREKDIVVPTSVKVRHIFVSARSNATTEERAKAHAKIEGALERLKKGEDFAKVAEDLSEDPSSAKNGGLIGTIKPGGSLESFEKVAFSLKPGAISGIVETPLGFHIIKVDERKEERMPSYDEAKDFLRKQLQDELEQARVKEFVNKAAAEAGLKIYPESITGKKEEIKGEPSPKESK